MSDLDHRIGCEEVMLRAIALRLILRSAEVLTQARRPPKVQAA